MTTRWLTGPNFGAIDPQPNLDEDPVEVDVTFDTDTEEWGYITTNQFGDEIDSEVVGSQAEALAKVRSLNLGVPIKIFNPEGQAVRVIKPN